MSTFFPEYINIGVVFKLDSLSAGNYYKIKVKLTNDMTSLRNVYVINNTHKKEIERIKILSKQ